MHHDHYENLLTLMFMGFVMCRYNRSFHCTLLPLFRRAYCHSFLYKLFVKYHCYLMYKLFLKYLFQPCRVFISKLLTQYSYLRCMFVLPFLYSFFQVALRYKKY